MSVYLVGSPTRILYCGSRGWIDVRPGLSLLQAKRDLRRGILYRGPRARIMAAQIEADATAHPGGLIIVEGEGDGADVMSRVIGAGPGVAIDPYPVDTAIDGPWPAAGHRRNARQARDGRPEAGRAFAVGDVGTPLSKGTAGMVAILRRMRLLVIVHRDNGIEVQS